MEDSGKNSRFRLAVRTGNVDDVIRMSCFPGYSRASPCERGFYVLCDAVRSERKEVVKILIENGCKVNIPTQYHETPLHCAIRNADFEMMDVLLEAGADVNVMIRDGTTPLMRGIRPAELLQFRDPSFHVFPFSEYTGFKLQSDERFIQVVERNMKIIEILVKCGADVNAISSATYEGYSPLLYAVEGRCLKIVELLIQKGAAIDYVIKTGELKGYSPLLYAVFAGNIQMVELLLKLGADVHCVASSGEHEGCTPLWLAVKRGHNRIFELLVEHGAVVNTPVNVDNITLHLSVAKGHLALTEHALKHGVGVDLRDMLGRTALHLTSTYGHSTGVEITKLLLQYGANVNAQTKKGVMPLHSACEAGDWCIVNVLLEHDAIVNCSSDMSPLHLASYKGHSEVVKLLLKFGANIDTYDLYGMTPLHAALLHAKKQVITTLLGYGADINLLSGDNRTVLNIVTGSPKTAQCVNNDATNPNSHIFCCHRGLHVNENVVRRYSIDTVNRHIIKMIVAKMNVNKKIILPIDVNYKNFEHCCVKEVNNLKSEKIGNSHISYYDLITKSVDQVASLYSYDFFVQSLDSNDYQNRFPLYARIIKSQIWKGCRRKKLLERINQTCLSVFHGLPYDCSRLIMSYLSDADLRNLIDVCQ